MCSSAPTARAIEIAAVRAAPASADRSQPATIRDISPWAMPRGATATGQGDPWSSRSAVVPTNTRPTAP